MNERSRRIFDEDGGCDFAYFLEVDDKTWRFRVNVLQQMGHVGLVARRVNNWIPNFEGLNLPGILEELCKFSQGMILLAGVTGSGKSTTIASMLDWVNRNYRKHILTLEDPIEFTFTEDKCLINQREIGLDVKDFMIGMKHAVREDPDVMLVGEMRDRETFETAIQAAETGHLVFGTIHASTAPSTIGRILDLFPESMHTAIRSELVFNMRGIIAQKLLPSIMEGVPRVPTVEIMTFSPTVRKLVQEADDAGGLMNGAVLANRILGFVNAPALMQRVVRHLQGVSVDISVYQTKRDMLCDGLAQAGYDFHKPEGAFYLFPKSPIPDDVEFVAELQKQNILAVPGKGFGGPGYFRLAYCVDDATIERSIPAFKRAMDACSK